MPNYAALVAAARAAQGQSQPGVLANEQAAMAGGSPDVGGLLAMLKGGRVSAGSLIQLLALLSGLGGQAPGGAAQAPSQSPIEAAFSGQ